MKQKEQLTAQEQKLEELTLKIEDVETLLDDVPMGSPRRGGGGDRYRPAGESTQKKIFV